MRKLNEYPQVLLKVLILHEAFRRLDFEPDQIFVEPNRDETGTIALFVLVKSGGREFRAIAGPVGDVSVEKMYDLWVELATRFNTSAFDESDEDAVYYKFWRASAGDPARSLVEALVSKGLIRADVDCDDLADRIYRKERDEPAGLLN